MPKQAIPRQDLVRFFAESDCYVSAARAEGFDLPAFDAAMVGLPILLSESGGPQDFASPDDVRIVSTFGVKPCHPAYYHLRGADWLGHDAADIGLAMRRAFEIGKKQVSRDLSGFQAANVGSLMRAELERSLRLKDRAIPWGDKDGSQTLRAIEK
jgi:glycosyltransferase involved in cell wall biosynthesis